MDKEALKAYLVKGQTEVDQFLHSYLPSAKCPPALIHEAVRYSLFAGGKRLRPLLCLAACEAVGGRRETALPFASAIELIHTYSLIHDDLPAMDNDTYRRGKLTNHKMFGESTAILAGDALLTSAFTLIAEKGLTATVSPKKILAVILELGSASGSTGMVGGQLVDIQSQGKKGIDLEKLNYIHSHKTGALIRASVRIGGILGGAPPKKLSHLTRYGEKAGLAFQIADDLLDVEGEEKELGKPVGQDSSKEKWTYPALVGPERARKEAMILVEQAAAELEAFGTEADPLRRIAAYMVERKK
ncbi:MAG TPA: farnesyl diphosphate synthase [Candidatus Manganitrophaceae bacterium]|nr:farnesyl diphosphate synthase [Candidatus Manganitrophaceae bacterium]